MSPFVATLRRHCCRHPRPASEASFRSALRNTLPESQTFPARFRLVRVRDNLGSGRESDTCPCKALLCAVIKKAMEDVSREATPNHHRDAAIDFFTLPGRLEELTIFLDISCTEDIRREALTRIENHATQRTEG